MPQRVVILDEDEWTLQEAVLTAARHIRNRAGAKEYRGGTSTNPQGDAITEDMRALCNTIKTLDDTYPGDAPDGGD